MTTYDVQLKSTEWKSKRKLILERDKFRCQNCLNKTLIDTYRISFNSSGFACSRLIYIIYDKELGYTHRWVTQFEKSFLFDLLRNSKDKSLVAVTIGKDA